MTREIVGWIKPDDGERVDGLFLDYECFRLNQWLEGRGRSDLLVEVELSPANAFHTAEDLLATAELDRLLPAATRAAEKGAAIIAWVCTSGSFVGGRAWAEELVKTLAARTGRPATSTSLAIVEALTTIRARQVDLLSPYPGELTARLVSFLREYGIGVAHTARLDCPTGGTSHRLDLAKVVERYCEERGNSTHPLLIPDTAINSLDLGVRLESIARRTVITANQATLWYIGRSLGRPFRFEAAGSLLAGTAETHAGPVSPVS